MYVLFITKVRDNHKFTYDLKVNNKSVYDLVVKNKVKYSNKDFRKLQLETLMNSSSH